MHQPGRLPKKTLVEQAASQTVDSALITRAVSVRQSRPVLRPDNLKVPSYVDEQRRVDDIAVFRVALTDAAPPADMTRLVELLHRSMPRPLILFLSSPRDGELISLALTHINLGDPDRATSVIDQSVVVPLKTIAPGALRVDNLNRTDLWALYRDLVRVAAADGQPASPSLSTEDALDLRGRLAALNAELTVVARDAKGEEPRRSDPAQQQGERVEAADRNCRRLPLQSDLAPTPTAVTDRISRKQT